MKLQCPSIYEAPREGEFSTFYNNTVKELLDSWNKKHFETTNPWYEANRIFDKMRKDIDHKVMAYLVEHDGVIDSWPGPFSEEHKLHLTQECEWTIDFRDIDSEGERRAAELQFIYFGSDYDVVKREGSKRYFGRETPGLVFHNEYKKEDSKAYHDATVKANPKHKMKFYEWLYEMVQYYVSYVPVAWAIMIGLWCLLGTTGANIFEKCNNVLGAVESLPGGLFILVLLFPISASLLVTTLISHVILTFAKSAGVIAGLVLLAVIIVAALVGYYFLHEKFRYKPSPWSSHRRYNAECKRYAKSQEYADLLVREKEYERISEEWHLAWFEYLKVHWEVNIR